MIAPNSLLAWRALMDKINKSSAGKFVGGAADMLLPEKASDLLTGPAYALQHPIDSAKLLLQGAQDASQNQFEKMYAAPTTSEAIGHGLAGAIPLVGPAAGMAGEEIGAGNTARGLGMATALLAPSLYHGVKPIVSEATGLMEAVKRAKNIDAIREANRAAKYDALANSARNANANYAKAAPDVSPIPGIEDTSVPNETLWRGGGESNVPGGTYYSTDPKVAKRYAKLNGDKKAVNSYSPNPYDQSLPGSAAKIDVESEAGLNAVYEILRRSGQESSGDINLDMEATLPYLRNKGYRQVQIPYMPSPEDSLAGPERVMLKPTGSLSQLRDDPNVRVPGMADPYTTSLPEPAPIDPLTGLPTRRDALKAGGAAALATAIGARAMEGMGKVPEIAAAADPVLGRAAPSALGREGFYRELKHRVTDFDPEGWDEGAYGTKVPTKLTEGVVSPRSGIDPSDPFDSEVMMNPDKERYFLSRMYSADADTDVSLPAKAAGSTDPFTQFNKHSDAPRYIKQVYKMGREENLREALRKFTDNLKAHDAGTVEEFDSQLRPHRIVHSEITPEAAMRLNTIEKPKVPIALSIPDKFDGPVTHFKLVDPDGVTQSVAAVPVGKRGAPLKKYMDRINSSMDRHVELEPNRSAMDLEPITPEEFNAMANKSWHNIEGYNGTPDRPNTVGISPRYTKRVSIRLLKDTMAAHIAENKRAAGKKPPPLLAKSPVLQDNPALTRFDFLRGVKKNDVGSAIPLLGAKAASNIAKSPDIIVPKLPKGIDIIDQPPQMLFRGTPGERPWVSKVPKATYFTHDPSYAQEYGHTYALDAPRMSKVALLDMDKNATYDLFKKVTGKNLDVEGGLDELMPHLNDLGLDAAHIPWLEALDDQYPRFSGPETILFHGKHGPMVTNPANYQPVLPPIDHRVVPAYRTRPTPEQIQALVEALRVRLKK